MLGRQGYPAGARRILAVQTQRIGDVVCFTPLLTALRRAFPAAQLHALVQPPADELLAGHPDLDGVIVYDPGRVRSRPGPFAALVREIRHHRFDWAVAVHAARGVSAALRLVGIPRRTLTWRYGAARPPAGRWFYDQAVVQERQRGTRHEVEYNLDMLRALGLAPEPALPSFAVPEAARARAQEVLRARGLAPDGPYAVLHPGHGGGRQEWPPEHYATLADRVHREWGWTVVLSGSGPERELCERVLARMGAPATNLAGELRLPELAALLEVAGLFVSVPTGPMHIAAAVGTPVLALLGPTELTADRVRFAPYHAPGGPAAALVTSPSPCACPRMRACAAAPCMAAIRPEVVFETAARLLTDGRKAHAA